MSTTFYLTTGKRRRTKVFWLPLLAASPLLYSPGLRADDAAENCRLLFQQAPETGAAAPGPTGPADGGGAAAEYEALLVKVRGMRARHKPETLPDRREIAETLDWIGARRERLAPYSLGKLLGFCRENLGRRPEPARERLTLSTLANLPVYNPHEHLSGSLRPEVLFRIASNAAKRNPPGRGEARLSRERFMLDYGCDESCRGNFPGFEKKFHWGTEELRERLGGDPLYWLEILRELAKRGSKEPGLTLKWTPSPARVPALEKALLLLSPGERELFSFHAGLERRHPHFNFRQMEDLLYSHPEIARRTVGIDLWGEEKGDFREMLGEEIEARASSLRLGERLGREIRFMPHAGETGDPRMVWAAVLLGAAGIGHGQGAAKDPVLMLVLKDLGIPIEACLSSNETLYPSTPPGFHPLRIWAPAGLKVFLATDDSGIFRTDIEKEYAKANRRYGVSLCDLARIRYAGLAEPAAQTRRESDALRIKEAMERGGCLKPQ